MKVIKKIIKFILNSLIVFSICSLILSINTKEIFYDLIYDYAFKPAIKNETEELTKTKIDEDKMDKVLDNNKTKELVNSYIEDTLSNLAGEEVDDDIMNKFLDYIKNNKKDFEEALNVTINDEDIEALRNSEEFKQLSDNYKNSVNQSKENMSKQEKQAVAIYNFIMSKDLKLILLGIIVICTILSALIDWSIHKWIQDTGANLLTSGIMLLAMSLTVEYFVNRAIVDKSIHFSTAALTKASIITTVSGAVIMIVYGICRRILTKRKVKE
ncbi:MAG: hypothetical protein IJI43_04175 [Bacilli bacterium]|nr:hypothetical protein [Bacilli bacterium]